MVLVYKQNESCHKVGEHKRNDWRDVLELSGGLT